LPSSRWRCWRLQPSPPKRKPTATACKGGQFTVTAAVDSSGRWSRAEPVILQIDTEPPQFLVADPDGPDADSFKNKDYEFYALKNFIRLTRMSHGVVVKTYNACRVE